MRTLRPLSRLALGLAGPALLLGPLLCGAATSLAGQVWSGGRLRVELRDARLTVTAGERVLVRDASIRFGLLEPVRVTVRESTPEHLLLDYTYASAAEAAGGQAVQPNGPGSEQPLRATVEITPLARGIRLFGRAPWARHLSIVMDDAGDHVFGLVEWLYPDNRHSPDLRGQVVPLDVEGAASKLMENYADAASAFYLSSLGYGSFFDSFARGRYSFAIGGYHEIYHETGTLDWYLFWGPDGARIDEGYFAVIGAPRHVPMWALGPVVWRDQNTGSAQVLDDVEHFARLRIPLTALWIDRPYSHGNNHWSAMDFGPGFEDPGRWIGTLRQKYGLELMTWIAPAVFSAEDSFPGLFHNFVGYFDLSDSAALAEFERRLRTQQYAFGVRGHKMDRADENFPLYQRWADGTPPEAQRTRYLYLYAKATDRMLRDAWGEDAFNFARGAYQRSQPYLGGIWGGDSRASWEGMAANLANGIRAGFLGFPVWGSDVGGYLGTGRIPEELYARWLELGAWSGLFEVKLDGAGGAGEDRPPWTYPERLQAIFRAAAEQRMRMLPTLYSLANTSARHGVLMQPLAYAFPADSLTWSIADEFLLGGMFLVAPVLAPGTGRPVYLPAGRWYALDDPAQVYEGGRTVEAEAPLERIPVFVRAGAVYLTGDVFAGSRRAWQPDPDGREQLTIHVVPPAVGDSAGFDYVDALDGDRVKPIALTTDARSLTLTAPALALGGVLEVLLPGAPRRVALAGRRVPVAYDSAARLLRIPFTAGQAIRLEILR